MWIIDNNTPVLERISEYNSRETKCDKPKNINSYDFSTLYTNIPHENLKKQFKWILEKAFFNNSKKSIYVGNYKATWYKQNNALILDQDTLLKHIFFLIDNIYITVGELTLRQTVGIPMGTNCAPYLANLYLYSLEFAFLDRTAKKSIYLARKFSNCFRYIDDLIAFNNYKLIDRYKNHIYPPELILNKENVDKNKCSFLDIDMRIMNETVITKLYDKRDDFKFTINSFPHLNSNIHGKRTHGILISQLLRYSKVCSCVNDFTRTSHRLIAKLLNQHFDRQLLKRKASLFYDKYYHIIKHYNITKREMIYKLFLSNIEIDSNSNGQ